MVYTRTSQIPQFTEHFIRQSGLFKYFQATTSCIDHFFILRIKSQIQLPLNCMIEIKGGEEKEY